MELLCIIFVLYLFTNNYTMTNLFFERYLKFNLIKKIILGILFVPTISGFIVLFRFRYYATKIHNIGIENNHTDIWYFWQIVQMVIAMIVALALNIVVLSCAYNYFTY